MFYLGDKEMNVTHSIFTNSYANFYGGAICSRHLVTVIQSNFRVKLPDNTEESFLVCLQSLPAHCNISGNIGVAIIVTLDNCTVSDNIVGIYSCFFLIVTHYNIFKNITFHGGAIYSGSSVTATHCNISKNTASQHGGAIYITFQ